ncbi:MAG TPA: hypothetical protein VNS09_26290 [Solirubrobacter sp.]|nr:hypothetical protein [Solirubrobacter sp.]
MSDTDRLAAALTALRSGERYRFSHCTVTVTSSPLCGRYVIEGQLAEQWHTTDDVREALEAVDEFQDHPMPAMIDARRCRLLAAATACYRRRDVHNAAGSTSLAEHLEATGDVYLDRARALSDEWETPR